MIKYLREFKGLDFYSPSIDPLRVKPPPSKEAVEKEKKRRMKKGSKDRKGK